MSTKREPGQFDCFAKLADDEPYFVLRAKDPSAPALVELWAAERKAQFGDYPKLEEALTCASAMRVWKDGHPEAKPSAPAREDYKPRLALLATLAALDEEQFAVIAAAIDSTAAWLEKHGRLRLAEAEERTAQSAPRGSFRGEDTE